MYITSVTTGLFYLLQRQRRFPLAGNRRSTDLGENEPLFGSGKAPAEYCGRNSVFGRIVFGAAPAHAVLHETIDSCQILF